MALRPVTFCIAFAMGIFAAGSFGVLTALKATSAGLNDGIGAKRQVAQNPKATARYPQDLLHLELGYVYPTVVPRGSKLTVTVQDAAGHMVGQREIKTEHDAPPYLMEVPLERAVYPLTVHARLNSILGDEYSETRQIAGAQVASADFVAIEMK